MYLGIHIELFIKEVITDKANGENVNRLNLDEDSKTFLALFLFFQLSLMLLPNKS